jgi:hypothetical protein
MVFLEAVSDMARTDSLIRCPSVFCYPIIARECHDRRVGANRLAAIHPRLDNRAGGGDSALTQ